jgi:hypothetical protein
VCLCVYMCRVGQNRIYTLYMTVCMVNGDFPAKNTVYTLYIPINVWFWPTLNMCMCVCACIKSHVHVCVCTCTYASDVTCNTLANTHLHLKRAATQPSKTSKSGNKTHAQTLTHTPTHSHTCSYRTTASERASLTDTTLAAHHRPATCCCCCTRCACCACCGCCSRFCCGGSLDPGLTYTRSPTSGTIVAKFSFPSSVLRGGRSTEGCKRAPLSIYVCACVCACVCLCVCVYVCV